MKPRLDTISDRLTAAHALLQQNYLNLDPVIGVRQHLRQAGFPADLVSIDCLKSNKRIILLLHDDQPESIGLQYSDINADPEIDFEHHPLESVTESCLYDWMQQYFAPID